MAMTFERLTPVFAAVVSGIDLSQPLSTDAIDEIHAGMDEHAVLVFHDQVLTDEQQIRFSQSLGPLEQPGAASNITKPEDKRLKGPIADISNIDKDNRLHGRDDRQRLFNLGNRLWHSDSSFRSTPAKYSLLSGRVVPPSGGNTEFADMRAAYDALDDDTRAEIDGLVCEHSLIYSRGQLGFADDLTDEERRNFTPVRQALVRRHSVTGRKSLYLSSHAGQIVGWPIPEARLFLRDLIEHATRERFVYSHKWRQHDLVIWDNRQTMHRVRAYRDTSEVRDMRRTTVAGDGETAEQVAA